MRRDVVLVVLVAGMLVLFAITPLPLALLLYPFYGAEAYLWILLAQVFIVVACALYEWRRKKRE